MKQHYKRRITLILLCLVWLGSFALQVSAQTAPAEPIINEFSISTAGTDVEYIEILGTPNTDYSSYRIVEIEGDDDGALGFLLPGTVDEIIPVGTTNSAGYWVTAIAANTIENGTVTLLLVKNPTQNLALNTDLDTTSPSDGVLDVFPWESIVDSVAVSDGGANDKTYSTVVLTPNYDGLSTFAPGGASLIPNGVDTNSVSDWVRNDFDLAGIAGFTGTPDAGEALNTPNAPNQVVGAKLVINEVDYDQASTDADEFVEIKNAGNLPINLDNVTLKFINAAASGGPAPYDTIDLPDVDLAVGDYFVVCANAATVANCDLDDAPNTNFIQNGNPDAIELLVDNVRVDVLSYGGVTTGFSEGAAATTDTTAAKIGLSRFPDGTDTDNNSADFSLRCITPGAANSADTTDCDGTVEPPAIVKIHTIQGSGVEVTGAGAFTVEAIVTGDFQRDNAPNPVAGGAQLQGFFIQEEDADADANPLTSEGIFVFCQDCPTNVSVGDKVQVTGTASDFFGMSQLTATTAGSVVVQSSNNPLPTPVNLTLPAAIGAQPTLDAAIAALTLYYEPYEGMLVKFTDTLTIAEHFQLARYGTIVLTQGGRPRQFTDINAPNAAGYTQHQIDVLSRSIILDDDDNVQNSALLDDVQIYHPLDGLSTTNYFRAGDTITNLTGVLHWSFAGQSGTDAWRIRPVPEAYEYEFTPANPRPTDVADVGGNLKVGAFNVLNYFTTIDTTASNNTGTCGPSGTMDCRGADSAAEFQRQQTKLVQAICTISPDIFGVMEIENNATSLASLRDAVNAVNGCGPYEFIDTGVIGTDAIKVGLLYKPAIVAPTGNFAILDSSVDPNFVDTLNRPALAQTFQLLPAGEKITVVVNHLKSKGSSCGAGDDDPTTGQGNCAETRRLAAAAEVAWLATDPTGQGTDNILVIGDLNAYRKESAISEFTNAGYVDLINQFVGPNAYSYLFGGMLGYLDHALASPALAAKATGAAELHINADEIPVFDYNDDIADAGEASFEEEPDALPLYEANMYRSSDHDPLVAGFNLNNGAKITIIKDAQPNAPDDFEFVVYSVVNLQPSPYQSGIFLDDDGNNANDRSNTTTLDVEVGDFGYAVTEKPAAGWETSIECRSDVDGRNFMQATDPNTGGLGVIMTEIASDEEITCRFINTKTTSITIVKEVVYVADLDTDSDRDFFFGGDLGTFELDDPLVEDGDAITDTKVVNDAAPGVYNVHESANGNWIQTVTCEGDTDNGSVYAGVGAEVDIDLDAGENIVCTFRNERVTYELTYAKVLEAAPVPGSDWQFTLQPDGEALISPFTTVPAAGGTSATYTLPLDAYYVGEIVPAGYDLKKINCDDGGTSVDFPASDNFYIILQQDMTCTFTNVEATGTSITIVKEVVYEADLDVDSDRDFFFGGDLGTFELDDPLVEDGDLVTDTKEFADQTPGVYNVHESADGNWIQTVTCEGDTDNGSVYAGVGAEVDIDLDAGENIVCTFRNERVTYELTYAKVLEAAPVPGSDWQFTLQPDGEALISPFTTAPAAGGTSATYTLPLDAYYVGEIVPAGYDLKKINCDDGGTSVDFPASDNFYIILQQDMTCTFTNVAAAPSTGSIRVTKDIIGDGTGVFTICVGADCREFNGDGAQSTWENLAPGQYVVTEQDAGGDWDEPDPQQVDVAAGQLVDVTVTNTYTPQNVCNQLDPLAHLTATIEATGNPYEYRARIFNSSVCPYDVGFAAYEKPDGNNANQVLFSSDTRLQIPQGETTIVITAPMCAAQLDVFFDASHLGVYNAYAGQQGALDQAPLVLPAFATGLYGPFGNWYGPRLIAYKHVGNSYCVEPRSITIQKVSGAPGYDANVGFTGDLGDFSVNGMGGLFTFPDLAPGVYNVTELVPDGWTLTSVTCNQQPVTINNNSVAIDVTNGDATCTFTNTFVPPVVRSITIQKVSGAPGYDANVGFTGDLGDFSVNGMGGLFTFPDLAPGVYNVTELVPENWSLTSVTCNQQPMTINNNGVAIDVTNGDATCTFTNTFVPPPDSDMDGVPDANDQCGDTPLGIPVDEVGCPIIVNVTFFNQIPCTTSLTFAGNMIELDFGETSAVFPVPAGTYTIPVTSSCTIETTHTVTIVDDVDFTLVVIPTSSAAGASSLE